MLGRIVAATLVVCGAMTSRENRPSYRYREEVVVGGELPRRAYESYPVPERHGVREHHYTIVNDRPVVFHPHTRRVIHVY